MEFEIIQIESERAVRRAADQFADVVDHSLPAITGEAHHFVFVLVYREAQVRRERGIEHSERMRKPDFTQERDRRGAVRAALAVAHGERGPLAYAIGSQDRRATRGRGEEGGPRVRLVVFGE